METFVQDVRYALRTLRKSPGFTTAALLTLALGIGATTAIFSVLHGVLLRPLPYHAPRELVRVYDVSPANGIEHGLFSPDDFADLAADSSAFASMAAYLYAPGQIGVDLAGAGEPSRLTDALVSSRFFHTLGVAPELGRVPAPSEYLAGADRVVVLSDALWRGRFGGDSTVVGRTVTLDGTPFTVVGVMPASFAYPGPDADVWVPISLITDDQIPRRRDVRWMSVVARLRPQVTVAAARRRAAAVIARLARTYPQADGSWTDARVVGLHDAITGDVRPALLALFGAVGLVLLIACVNIANLLLVRTTGRSREIAVRTAFGATRSRVARQFLVESLVLAGIGGALGLALATWTVRVLVTMADGAIPRAGAVGLDLPVVGFAGVVAVVSAMIFGMLPAWRAAHADVRGLHEGGRGAAGGRRRREVRTGLTVAETALAMLLLVGAGLMVKSLLRLTHVDPGLHADRVLTMSVVVSSVRHPTSEARAAYRDALLERLGALPGVVAVGGSKTLPLHGGGERYGFTIPGRASDAGAPPMTETYIVTPGYFAALGIPVLRGRAFTAADRPSADAAGSMPGVVVNRSFARRYWPGVDPVGKTLALGNTTIPVIGVVGDVRNDGLADAPTAAVYAPISVFSRSHLSLFLRTAGDPLALIGPARRAIRSLDPEQTITDVTTVDALVSTSVAQPRFFTVLVALFAGLALGLSAVGLYGVLAFNVQERTRELGIRIALGAERDRVLAMVFRESMALTGGGLAVGAVGAVLLTRLLASQLYGVSPTDPATFVASAIVLALVAAGASTIPARRATQIDPMEALRHE